MSPSFASPAPSTLFAASSICDSRDAELRDDLRGVLRVAHDLVDRALLRVKVPLTGTVRVTSAA